MEITSCPTLEAPRILRWPLECRKTGTLEHWKTGTLEHWKTGTLEHWNTGTA
jgi:hypothetical protein